MSPALDHDLIAAWICDAYQSKHSANPAARFEALPEFLKADNRDAAIRIGRVLAMAGLRLEPREDGTWPDEEQREVRALIEGSIDVLAEAEHDGWVESRLRNGWQLGLKKDMDRRESHLLVPYSKLRDQIARKREQGGSNADASMSIDDEVQLEMDKDRDSVRRYVDIIARTSYRIVKEG